MLLRVHKLLLLLILTLELLLLHHTVLLELLWLSLCHEAAHHLLLLGVHVEVLRLLLLRISKWWIVIRVLFKVARSELHVDNCTLMFKSSLYLDLQTISHPQSQNQLSRFRTDSEVYLQFVLNQ